MLVREAVATTTRSVKNAYWDLVFSINSLEVQRLSLDLAQRSLKENRARVEIGTMAPIDIVQAEAEVAQREEAVIIAEAAIAARRRLAARAHLRRALRRRVERAAGSHRRRPPSRRWRSTCGRR